MFMTKGEFEQKKKQLMVPLAQEYNLKYCQLGDDVALVGKRHAVLFLFDKWNTDTNYLLFNGNDIIEYPFNNFVSSNVMDADRIDVIWKDGCYDHALADLRVIINVFQNRMSDILTGDATWITQYKNSKYGYEPGISTLAEAKIKVILQVMASEQS